MTYNGAKAIPVAISGLLFLAPMSWAATPTEEVREMYTEAKRVIHERRPGDTAGELEAAIASVIRGRLAFRRAAEASLGDNWARLTEPQREEFTRLLGQAIEARFLTAIKARVDITRGRRPKFLGEEVTRDSAIVRTSLSGTDGKVKSFDYRLTRRASPEGDRWAIEDFVVEGVSLVENYRAQFNEILKARSPAGLIALMRDKTLAMRAPEAPVTTASAPPAVGDATFAPNDSVVGEAAKRLLDEHAARLKARDAVRVVIEGHADARGTARLNQRLAMARARAVRDYLVARGIDAGRLTLVTRGSDAALCLEQREACWVRNRRVHLRIVE